MIYISFTFNFRKKYGYFWSLRDSTEKSLAKLDPSLNRNLDFPQKSSFLFCFVGQTLLFIRHFYPFRCHRLFIRVCSGQSSAPTRLVWSAWFLLSHDLGIDGPQDLPFPIQKKRFESLSLHLKQSESFQMAIKTFRKVLFPPLRENMFLKDISEL